METQLDPSIVALTKAIGHQESGGQYDKIGDNGHSRGAYQWNNSKPLQANEVPENFKEFAKNVGANSEDFSPENQDRVAYKTVEKWGKEGLTPAQIASKWNSGNPDAYKTAKAGYNAEQGVNYDVGAYVNNVAKYYDENMKRQPQQQTASKSNFVNSATLPNTQPQQELKATGGNLASDLTGTTKLGQGIGYTISNALGTQKDFTKSLDDAISIQSKILKAIKENKAQGKDTTRLEKSLKDTTEQIQQMSGQAENIGTGGLKNKDIIKSAAKTAVIPTLMYGGGLIQSALSGGTAIESPIIKSVIEAGAKGEPIKNLSTQEIGDMIIQASKTAPPGAKVLFDKAIQEISEKFLKEQGVKASVLKKLGGSIGGLVKSAGWLALIEAALGKNVNPTIKSHIKGLIQ